MLAKRNGKDPTHALDDLQSQLTAEPAPPTWSVFGASLLVVLEFASEDVRLVAPFVKAAVIAWPEVRDAFEESQKKKGLGPLREFEALVWVCAHGIQDAAGLQAWLTMLSELPSTLIARIFSSVIGRQSSEIIANRPVSFEYDKEDSERDWSGASTLAERIEEVAKSIGATPLAAAATAARIVCMTEGLGRFEDAERVANAAVGELNDRSDDAFLIAKAMGFSWMDGKRPTQAERWLRNADSMEGNLHGLDRVHVKLRLSQLAGDTDTKEAVRLAVDAAALAQRVPRNLFFAIGENEQEKMGGWPKGDAPEHGARAGDTLVVRAFGELAIARWLAGDRNGAYAAWIDTIQSLIESRADEDEHWRSLFGACGHVSGYLVTIVTTGAPPEQNVAGDHYTEPYRGMLLSPNRQIASLYQPERVPILASHAMILADAISEGEMARNWARRSAALHKSAGLWAAATIPLLRLIQGSLMDGAYEDAIEHAMDAASAFWTARDLPQGGSSILTPTPSPNDVIGPRDEAAWVNVEAIVIELAVLPAFFRIAFEAQIDPKDAMSAAETFRDACLNRATVATGTDIWSKASDLCTKVFLAPIGAKALMLLSKDYSERGEDSYKTLGAAAYFGASLDVKLGLEDVLWIQAQVAPHVQQRLSRSGIFASVVLPFFTNFWRKAFDVARYRFSAPRLVEQRLEEALASTEEVRLPRLLEAMATGLGARVPESIRDWFNSVP